MKIVKSVAGVPIRLTPERLAHIEARHIEMRGEEQRILETAAEPDFVQQGDADTLIAIRHYEKTPLTQKYCSVVYRELDEEDGFVLTAYFTSRPAAWRKIVWKP
jgi:hypothetical protein